MQFFPKIWSKEKGNPPLNEVLKGIIGYTPKNKALFKTAFTHRSVNSKNEDGVFIELVFF